MFAVLVTAETSQRHIKIVNRHSQANLMITPRTQNFNVFASKQRRGSPSMSIRASACVTKVQERCGDRRKQGDCHLQSPYLRELHVFNATTRLHRLVIFLDNPSTFIPANHAPGSLKTPHRFVGYQNPLDSIFSRRRINLGYLHHPQGQRIVAMVAVLGMRVQAGYVNVGHSAASSGYVGQKRQAWPFWLKRVVLRRVDAERVCARQARFGGFGCSRVRQGAVGQGRLGTARCDTVWHSVARPGVLWASLARQAGLGLFFQVSA